MVATCQLFLQFWLYMALHSRIAIMLYPHQNDQISCIVRVILQPSQLMVAHFFRRLAGTRSARSGVAVGGRSHCR